MHKNQEEGDFRLFQSIVTKRDHVIQKKKERHSIALNDRFILQYLASNFVQNLWR